MDLQGALQIPTPIDEPGCGLDAPPTVAPTLADSHYQPIFAWFFWLTGCRELAADLTQTTFAGYWESLARRSPRDPVAWLFVVARNQWRRHCRDERRRRARSSGLFRGEHALATAEIDRPAHVEDLRRRVFEAVSALPAAYREPLVLRFWAQQSCPQIARILGRPSALIRWRLHHAAKLLRAALPAELLQGLES